jgi:two-component system, chemotaxis family, response regulator PixH
MAIRALIVDDVKTDLIALSDSLELEGWHVVMVESGEEALKQLHANLPDIIVLDVVLPGKSGYEICREIKNQPHTKHIPVVICSSKGSDMDRFWGMKQGAIMYLTKPCLHEDFISSLKKAIGN